MKRMARYRQIIGTDHADRGGVDQIRKERELTMQKRLMHIAPHGTVTVPPSKSEGQRALLAAALAGLYGEAPAGQPRRLCLTVDSSGRLCLDIRVMADCLRALGCRIREDEAGFLVSPLKLDELPQEAVLPCGESGATLRFLLPVAAALCAQPGLPHDLSLTLMGEGRLPLRPISPLEDVLAAHGARIRHPAGDSLPLTVEGGLCPGDYEVSGEVSSQLVSGLLFALPLLRADSTLTVTGRAVSRPYVRMTCHTLAQVTDAMAEPAPGHYLLRAARKVAPEQKKNALTVGGDWSAGGFLLALGVLSRDPAGVTVCGLRSDSLQGDAAILPLLEQMGGDIRVTEANGRLTLAAHPARLRGIRADLRDTPDIAPVLAVCAAAAEGSSVLTGVRRLRDKESDRLAELCELLGRYSVRTTVSADGDTLTVQGRGGAPVPVDPVVRVESQDHRSIMAAALCAAAWGGVVEVAHAEAVDKSYPGFWRDLERLTAGS